MLNIGSMCTKARVVAVKSDLAKLQLTFCDVHQIEKRAVPPGGKQLAAPANWGQIQKGVTLD